MKYLSIDEVLAIHHEITRKFKGKEHVLSFTLLHSAVERPRASFGGKELYTSVFDKAAALLQSLILNHPFQDGNKRTAYVTCARFLFINGYQLETKQKNLITFILKSIKEKTKINKISLWLKNHSTGISTQYCP